MPVAFDAAPLLAPGLPAPSAPPLALGLALLPALEFAAPWALLVLVPALALVAAIRRPWWQAARRAGPGPRRREAWLLARRALWVSLLILALAGPTLVRPVRRQAVVLVVDGSASTAGVRDRAEAWIREALAALPRGDQAGVVVAADGARVEEPPGPAPVFGRLAARIPQGASDLAAGLQLAGAILPEGYAGRVVVLTDGRSNRGDPEAVARALAARGIPVDVVPLGPEAAADARLTAVSLPELAYAGEESTLTARIETDGPLAARLRIYRDGALVAERPLRLGPGEWTVTVPVDTGPPGLHRYEVSLDPEDPDGDSIPLNNRLGAVQRVEGPPRVLVLTPDPGAVQPLAAALAAGAAEVEVRTPDRAPADLAGWAAYHAVVLADLPARALTPAAQEQLEAYVRDLGRGLVMTGGPRSFGLGGWEGTPVERALPVYMDLRGRGRLPTVALAVVIDKSGSMGGGAGAADKMGLAKEAAVRSVGLLRPRDQVAVIAFDSVAQVVVPLREVGDGAGLREAIGSIYADGGTEIYPALRAAYLTLAGAEADLKHVILLTDGRSGSGGDYGALVRQMEEAGITLSTVAVGSDADTLLLEALAQAGGGRYYFTESPGAIPEIFTRETSLIARNLAVNLRFHPAAAAPSLLLRGLSPVPPLEGYVAVTPKERAEVALVSPEGDPVLAAWQYGAGRAVAWTSDLGGRWAGAWARSPAFATLWGNVLGWVLPGARSGNLQVRADVAADGSVTLTAETPGDWTVAPVRAAVVGPDGHRQEVDLQPAGPGAYRARLAGLAPGAYVATVTRELPGEASQRGEVAWVTPYPAEYRAMGVDRTALERLAAAGQGRVLTDPREAMAGPVAPVRARVPLAPFLLVLAALAWPLEIAGRRLVLTGEDWARALAWLRGRLPWARPGRAAAAEGAVGAGAATAAPGLVRLQAARERVRRRQGLLREGPRGEGAEAPPAGVPPGTERLSPPRPAAAPEEPAWGTGLAPSGPGPAPAGTEPASPAAAGTAADGDTPAAVATAQRLLAAKRRLQHRGGGR